MSTCPILLPDDLSGSHGQGRSDPSALLSTADLTKLKRATAEEADGRNELAWLLVLDNLVDAGGAEIRWLDRVGTRLARGASRRTRALLRDIAGSDNERSTEGVTP
jgi:hypothetical protein